MSDLIALALLALAGLIVLFIGLGIIQNAKTPPLLIIGIITALSGGITMFAAVMAPFF